MRIVILFIMAVVWSVQASAQGVRVLTVDRPPFATMDQSGEITGFSIDLLEAVMTDINQDYTVEMESQFTNMLRRVQTGDADAAIANISITAEREQILDFSQPIFASGLQIMTYGQTSPSVSVFRAIFSKELVYAVLAAFALLFGGGMIMWWFEHGRQEYFNRPAREAGFPAFWWALNLVVNGGFEERVPRSAFGRIFAVILVISSLFIVSIFVARITSVMTIDAIQSSVISVNDLDGKAVVTIEGSTASDYLQAREIRHKTVEGLEQMFAAFENREADAVVFDAPLLAYYINTNPDMGAELVSGVFLPENYGIALTSESTLSEQINQSLLKLRENGTYEQIYQKWFGI